MVHVRSPVYWCASSTKQVFENLILAKWNSMRHAYVANKHQDHPHPLHSQSVPMRMTLSQGSGLEMVYLTT